MPRRRQHAGRYNASVLSCHTPRPCRLQCAHTRHVLSFSVVGPPTGAENCRLICGPGLGGSPNAKPFTTLPKLSLVMSSYVSLQHRNSCTLTQAPMHPTSSHLKMPSLVSCKRTA